MAGQVKWEFTDSTMGYSYGAPVVVKTVKYGWVVILTSGYNNSDGFGLYLFREPEQRRTARKGEDTQCLQRSYPGVRVRDELQ